MVAQRQRLRLVGCTERAPDKTRSQQHRGGLASFLSLRVPEERRQTQHNNSMPKDGLRAWLERSFCGEPLLDLTCMQEEERSISLPPSSSSSSSTAAQAVLFVCPVCHTKKLRLLERHNHGASFVHVFLLDYDVVKFNSRTPTKQHCVDTSAIIAFGLALL